MRRAPDETRQRNQNREAKGRQSVKEIERYTDKTDRVTERKR